MKRGSHHLKPILVRSLPEKSGGKATLIEKLAKGDPIVAQYGFKRLLADTKYDASKRALMALESEKSGIQTLLKTMTDI